METEKMVCERTEWTDKKGTVHQLVSLKKSADTERGFQIGLAKAKLVVENIDAIRDFVIEMETPEAEDEEHPEATLAVADKSTVGKEADELLTELRGT